MIAFVRIPAAAWGAFCAVALFIITSAACVFAAEPVVIDESFNSAAIGRNLEILIDADRRYTIDEVSSPNSACGFSPSDSDHPNFGYMHGAVWARFTLDNRTAEAFDLLLELPRLVHPLENGPHYYILPHDNYYQRFVEQTRRVLNRLLENPSSLRTMVVICHGGTASTMLRMILGCHHLNVSMANTAMHYLTWQDGLWDLRGVNYAPHLVPDLLS